MEGIISLLCQELGSPVVEVRVKLVNDTFIAQYREEPRRESFEIKNVNKFLVDHV